MMTEAEERNNKIAQEIYAGELFIEEAAEKYGLAINTIRAICVKNGVITSGRWKDKKSKRKEGMTLEEFISWANSKGKVDKKTGCLLWTGTLTEQGYVRVRWQGKLTRLHQLVCRHKYNRDLNLGECCLHSCDTRNCYNQEHLRIGTNYDNVLDRESRGRNIVPKGEDNGNSKLKNFQAIEIAKLLIEGKLSHTEISRMYNISPSTIYLINKKKRFFQAISKEIPNWAK